MRVITGAHFFGRREENVDSGHRVYLSHTKSQRQNGLLMNASALENEADCLKAKVKNTLACSMRLTLALVLVYRY